MPGLKRQRVEEDSLKVNGSKKVKANGAGAAKADKSSLKLGSGKKSGKDYGKSKKPAEDSSDLVESDTTEDENGIAGFSASEAQEDAEGASKLKGSTDGLNGSSYQDLLC